MSEINIVDFQYIYYKYINMLRIGRLRQLSFEDMDTTMLYYPIKEIEGFSKNGRIPTCVCFDSKADKKEMNTEYKSQRKSTLTSNDFDTILRIKNILQTVGYYTYKLDGYEADDLVASLVKKLHDEYDVIHVYSVDKDLLQLVDDKVKVHLFRARHGYCEVNKDNFGSLTEDLFKIHIPFNLVKAYKCLVGDSSDNIKGVKGFGGSAFQKWLFHNSMEYEKCNDDEYLKELFMRTLSPEQFEDAINALEMVSFREVETYHPIGSFERAGRVPDRNYYAEYGMTSFLK